jgi:hypothetical protein
MQYSYKTHQLLDSGVDFAKIYPKKQDVVKEMTGFDFNLANIVTFLKSETDDFTKQIPLALDLDKHIYAVYNEWVSKGEQKGGEQKIEEKKDDEGDNKAEWNEATDTLKMLVKDKMGTKKDIAEWKEAIDTLEMLLSTI